MKIMYLALLSIFYTGVGMANNYEISKAEQAVNIILSTTAKNLEDLYPLRACGEGAAMPDGNINKLTLAFNTTKRMTKEELRKLLLKTSLVLIQNINENSDVQNNLTTRPFTEKNVQVIIYNLDSTGLGSFDPDITTSQISRGVLTYRKVESADKFVLTDETNETYEEALKLVNR